MNTGKEIYYDIIILFHVCSKYEKYAREIIQRLKLALCMQ